MCVCVCVYIYIYIHTHNKHFYLRYQTAFSVVLYCKMMFRLTFQNNKYEDTL